MTQAMYSLDAEEFGLDTPKDVFEALERQHAFVVGTAYFVAACERVRPGSFDVVSTVLERLGQEVYLQAGDAAHIEAENLGAEAKGMLNACVNEWALEYLQIGLYWKPVTAPVELTVTADDVDIYWGLSGTLDVEKIHEDAASLPGAAFQAIPASAAEPIALG